jgi:hypothetical protein
MARAIIPVACYSATIWMRTPSHLDCRTAPATGGSRERKLRPSRAPKSRYNSSQPHRDGRTGLLISSCICVMKS